MKIAFSTLGCPDFDWPDIYSMAKDLGFDGIEMRGLGDDLFAVNARPFRADQIDKTIALLARMHLTIPCLSSGCVLKDTENWPATREEIGDYIRLAARLGSSYIRLLADRNADKEGEVDDEVVLAHLKEVLPLAEEKGVMLLLETNGVYADTARLRDLLVRAESDSVGALWDMHHPYRFAGESPGAHRAEPGRVYQVYPHQGLCYGEWQGCPIASWARATCPMDAMMRALRSINYEGFVSLEWVKRYMPDLRDAGIVFPHFANYMAASIWHRAGGSHRLQDNHAQDRQVRLAEGNTSST